MALKALHKQEARIKHNKKLVMTINWCKACGICMALCPQDVLGAEAVTNKVVLLAPENCTGCGLCELACPDYVFTIEN